MSRVASCLLALLGGCSFELVPGAGSVIDSATPVIDAAPDARIIDAPPSSPDIDMDTVLNGADNCPTVANTNQRNHDGDNRGDACDVCPHLSSVIHADNDVDGIGDDCDPRPTQSGDTVALWDGFYADSAALGWDRVGSWTLENGVLRQTAMGINYIVVPGALQRTFVQMSATVDNIAGTNSSLGPFAGDVYPGTTQSYGCLVQRDTTSLTAQTFVATAYWTGGAGFTKVGWAGLLVPGKTFAITEKLSGTLDCSVREAGGAVSSDSEAVGPTLGRPGIYMDDVSARVDYLYIVAAGA